MKKHFKLLAFLCLAAMFSCSDEISTQSNDLEKGEKDVRIVVAPDIIKSVSTYSISDMINNSPLDLRYTMEIYLKSAGDTVIKASDVTKDPENARLVKRDVQYLSYQNNEPLTDDSRAIAPSYNLTFNYRLPQGEYDVLVWVDYVDRINHELSYYDNSYLYKVHPRIITNPNDDAFADIEQLREIKDAFFGNGKISIKANSENTKTITAKHAVAKVNYCSSDWLDLSTANFRDHYLMEPPYDLSELFKQLLKGGMQNPIQSIEISYVDSCNYFNVAKGYAMIDKELGGFAHHYSINFKNIEFNLLHGGNQTNPLNSLGDLLYFSDYVLAGKNNISTKNYIQDVQMTTTFAGGNTHILNGNLDPNNKLAFVPVGTTKITNIVGNLFTEEAKLTVKVSEDWTDEINSNYITTETDTKEITSGLGFNSDKPFSAGKQTILLATVSGNPHTESEDDILKRFEGISTSCEFIEGIEVKEEEYDGKMHAPDFITYKVYATLKANTTAYNRSAKIKVQYTNNRDNCYYQHIYQAASTSYNGITIYGISNVKGLTTGFSRPTAQTAPLTDEFQISAPYALVENTERNEIQVLVYTRRNPKNLKLVKTPLEAGKVFENGSVDISQGMMVKSPSNLNEVPEKEWDLTKANYILFTISVKANITPLTSTPTNYVNKQGFHFTDYNNLYEGKASPISINPADANTVKNNVAGTISTVSNAKGENYGFSLTSNLWTKCQIIKDDNTTVQNTTAGEEGAYFSRTGKTGCTLQFKSSAEITNVAFGKGATNVNVVKTTGDWNTPNTYTITYNIDPLTTSNSRSIACTITGKYTGNNGIDLLTNQTIYSKTIYQAGYTHAWSKFKDENNKDVYGYNDGSAKKVQGSDVNIKATSTGINVYLRTNLLTTKDDVKKSLKLSSNLTEDNVTVTNMDKAIFTDTDKINYEGDHVYLLHITIPENTTTNIVKYSISSTVVGYGTDATKGINTGTKTYTQEAASETNE